MRCRETGTSVAPSRCTPVSPTPDACGEPSAPPFSSTSTISRFRAKVPSLSSLRTIPSWRSSLFNKPYAKILVRTSSEESDVPNPSDSSGAGPHHTALNSLRHRNLRRRRQNKRSTNQDDPLHASVPLSNLSERSWHSSTRRQYDSSSRSSGSLSTRPSSSSDFHTPSPSTSEESYPSPYSADALAVFHIPTNKRASFFKSRRKHEYILEDRVQVIFEEATDATSTSAGVSSVHSLARRRGRISCLKRRIRTLAESMSPPRSKAPAMFNNERRSPHLDDDSVEYDIPCLAYISCIW